MNEVHNKDGSDDMPPNEGEGAIHLKEELLCTEIIPRLFKLAIR